MKFPVLESPRLRLRKLTVDDVPAWFARASDPESSRLAGNPIPSSIDVCYQWLEFHDRTFAKSEGIRWAIEPKQLGFSVGSIGLFNLSAQNATAEIGAVVGRQHWNQGYVTEAANLIIDYAQRELSLAEIFADALSSNSASKRVLDKLGFAFTRTIADYQETDDGVLPGELFTLALNQRNRLG